jgi:hypothetical protein
MAVAVAVAIAPAGRRGVLGNICEACRRIASGGVTRISAASDAAARGRACGAEEGATSGFRAGICGAGREVAVAPGGVITYFASWPGAASPVNSAQLGAPFRDACPQDRPNPMSILMGTVRPIAVQPSRAAISACSKVSTEKDRLSCICKSGTRRVA